MKGPSEGKILIIDSIISTQGKTVKKVRSKKSVLGS